MRRPSTSPRLRWGYLRWFFNRELLDLPYKISGEDLYALYGLKKERKIYLSAIERAREKVYAPVKGQERYLPRAYREMLDESAERLTRKVLLDRGMKEQNYQRIKEIENEGYKWNYQRILYESIYYGQHAARLAWAYAKEFDLMRGMDPGVSSRIDIALGTTTSLLGMATTGLFAVSQGVVSPQGLIALATLPLQVKQLADLWHAWGEEEWQRVFDSRRDKALAKVHGRDD